jgi:hypothetical protein
VSGELCRLSDEVRQPSEVLGDGREHELVLCAARSSQTKPAEPKDALQMGEPHLNALAVMS